MIDAHLDAEFLVDVLGQMLGTIHATVLSTRTSETEHQAGETALYITPYVGIGQLINAIEESEYLAVVL